jgi:SAM-dependent methyltransferase
MSFTQPPEFDRLAENYESFFKPWLKLAGSTREHFARARVTWLSKLLRNYGAAPRVVMDFGCGTGIAIPLLLELLAAEQVIGIDPSERSLDIARSSITTERVSLGTMDDYSVEGQTDIVFCNGVFHHIGLAERASAVEYISRTLRPGGFFALWENNPWNPIVRYGMKIAELDKNAIAIPAPAARKLVQGHFNVIRTDYLFFFPAYLRGLFGVEKLLVQLPLGAQYQVLSQKKANSGDGEPMR